MMKSIAAGPYGGKTGDAWDDGVHSGIKQLIIRYEIRINSIQVQYHQQDGCSEWRESHGSDTGDSCTIELHHPDEYLTSISGFYSEYLNRFFINSLTIQSNRRTFGPFGRKRGKYFLVPPTVGKIVGFFGDLGSIGAYLEPTYPFQSFGPFGGEDGVSWDDGRYTTIRQLKIEFESVIKSICVEYDRDGSSVWSSTHGESGDGTIRLVKIDYPSEFVTSISGYCRANPFVIQSLTIRTNRRSHGPFGVEKGKYFSLPSTTAGKIIGFHGKCGPHLNSIGVHCEPPSDLNMLKTEGPFGVEDGEAWDDGFHAGIKQIKVMHGSYIISICTEYHDISGSSNWCPLHGEVHDQKAQIDMIRLDYPTEFLTSVILYYTIDDNFCDSSTGEIIGRRITSITFRSNRKMYGPFGREVGNYFSFPSFYGKIIGFHGKCGDLFFSIGAHVERISNPPFEFVDAFGSTIGEPWDDGIHSAIRQLEINCGSIVNSIRVGYDEDKDEETVWSSNHGTTIGSKTYKIQLDLPDEYLISLSGFYRTDSNPAKIDSLTFHSNKRTYGPFGTRKRKGKGKEYKDFSLSPRCGKILGFHGSSSDSLHSIGVYLKPFPASRYKKLELHGARDGNLWDDGAHTTVRQIIIGASSIVHSIQIEYDDQGHSAWSIRHGVNDGKKYMVKLNYPNEFLVSVSGSYCSAPRDPDIQSLKLESNIRTYGPFGAHGGNVFSIPVSGGKITGFHGTTFYNLRAIGVYRDLLDSVTVGPWGGLAGSEWNDGVYSTIRRIQLTLHYIIGTESIRFEYDDNGRSMWSMKHGCKSDGRFQEITLDYPGEFLISVEGTFSEVWEMLVVRSLKFISNKKSYGPFGEVRGKPFVIPPNGTGKIIGFHGRSGYYIDSIGAHLDPTADVFGTS